MCSTTKCIDVTHEGTHIQHAPLALLLRRVADGQEPRVRSRCQTWSVLCIWLQTEVSYKLFAKQSKGTEK